MNSWVTPCRACGGRDFDLQRKGDTLARFCTPCRRKTAKKWRAANLGTVNRSQAKYRAANLEAVRQRDRDAKRAAYGSKR